MQACIFAPTAAASKCTRAFASRRLRDQNAYAHLLPDDCGIKMRMRIYLPTAAAQKCAHALGFFSQK